MCIAFFAIAADGRTESTVTRPADDADDGLSREGSLPEEAVQPTPRLGSSPFVFVLAANRDEVFSRPTADAQFWEDHPSVLGGYDLLKEATSPYGTWLGVTKTGRVAVLTNIREPEPPEAPHGRGELCRDFLISKESPAEFCTRMHPKASDYGGMNLLVGDLAADGGPSFWFLRNREGDEPHAVEAGIHGLSNATLDSPWPKLELGKDIFSKIDLTQPREALIDALLALLSNTDRATLDTVQQTGIPVETEMLLSSICIDLPSLPSVFDSRYGTRAQTIILAKSDGGMTFVENVAREKSDGKLEWERQTFDFNIYDVSTAPTESSSLTTASA